MLEVWIYMWIPHMVHACKSTVTEKIIQENANDDKSLNKNLDDIMSKHTTDHTIRSVCIAIGIIVGFVVIYYIYKYVVKKCKRNLIAGLQDTSERRIVSYARRLSQAAINRHEDNIIPK